MSIDDPGWGGYVEEEPPGGPAPEAWAAAPAEGSQPPSPPGRRSPRGLVLAVVALVVLAAAGAGAAVTLSSKKGGTTTTTVPTTAGNSAGGTGGTGGGEPPLQGVVPSALSGTCSATPSADFVSTKVTDEIACDAANVSGSSADLVGYARFGSTSALSGYFSGLLGLNSMTAQTGDCANGSLSGTTSQGAYCTENYQDSSGNSGIELAFVGSAFDVGGAAGSSASFCSSNFPGSSGVSVVAWTSPGDDSFGFAVDCTASTQTFAQGMLSNLLHAAYALND